MSMETIKKTLDDYNEIIEQVNNAVCKKYNVEDIDIICAYPQTLSTTGKEVIMGTYRKHSGYVSMNEKRYSIPFDELEKYNGKSNK